MKNLKNNIQLIGHLGRNPEISITRSGKKVAKLLLAISEYRKNNSGEKETHTSWHNLVAWGPQAEIAERYLIKGKQIAIQGKLETNKYIDSLGHKRYYTQIIISDLQMIA